MIIVILKKIKFKINLKSQKSLFLIIINLIPVMLILFTSILTGAKIRTMWMTPFYLFLNLFLEIFRKNIEIKKKKFYYVFLFFFFLSPV